MMSDIYKSNNIKKLWELLSFALLHQRTQHNITMGAYLDKPIEEKNPTFG